MQIGGSTPLELEDEVNFTAGVHTLTGAYKATRIALLMTAAERSNKRELGQVIPREWPTTATAEC